MEKLVADSPIKIRHNKGIENDVVSGIIMYGTCILVAFMPVASGSRGFSESLGRNLLASCDALLIGLFLIAIPYSRARLVSSATILLIVLSAAYLMVDEQFPPFAIAYQGVRKSILWLLAIVLGAALREKAIGPVCATIMTVLTLVCLYGIKQYFIQSPFDAQLLSAQSASIYANKIGQYTRATSVLSSGFHLGMAGCILICLTVYAKNISYFLRISIISIALFGIYASFTRTFLIVALGVIAIRLTIHSRARIWSSIFIAILTITALQFFKIDLIGTGVSAAANDDRFAGRSESYIEFFSYLAREPLGWLIGFGPGTAGSTLGDQYLPFGVPWIEPHNVFTKYIFEFGLPVALYVYVSIAILAASKRDQSSRYSASSARMALFVLCVSGLTITSVETWPVSIYVGLLLGMLCAPSRPSLQTRLLSAGTA